MLEYAIRRVLLIIPTIIILTMAVFFFQRIVPNETIESMVEERIFQVQSQGVKVSPDELRQVVIAKMGLDVPVWEQYLRWVGEVFRGNFGKSLWSDRTLFEMMRLKVPISAELSIFGIIFGTIFSWPWGILAAIRQDTAYDHFIRFISIITLAVPGFWLATVVMVYPAIWWGWSPPVQYIPITEDFWGNIKQFIIPSFLGGLLGAGGGMRMARALMLEVLRQDYIRTAWSKGLRERTVVLVHALKNALIPIVGGIVGLIPGLLSSSVIMEQIFSLPGMGRYLLEVSLARDYLIVSGYNLIASLLVMFTILITDLTYAVVDPRIRYR